MLSAEDIAALAPDQTTAQRARFLANAAVWQNPDLDKSYVARAQILASPFYQVSFDFINKKGHCTCFSRHDICVHQIGLAFFFIENAHFFPKISPDSDSATIEKTNDFTEKRLEKPKDERLESLIQAFDDLEIWIIDAIQSGLAALADDNNALQNAAARAVDGKMTAIGRQLRLLASNIQQSDVFFEKSLDRFADFYLAAQTFQKRHTISEGLKFDLMAVIGVNLRKDFIRQIGESIRDIWTVVGQTQYSEEQLKVRKIWLLGQKTNRFALFLEYSMENQPFLDDWPTGFFYEGTLVFYPSGHPQRAVPNGLELLDKIPNNTATGYFTFSEMGKTFAKALASQPWLSEFPAVLTNCQLIFQKNQFYLLDSAGFYADYKGDTRHGWQLISTSGGHPMTIFGSWDGRFFEPMSHFSEDRWQDLATNLNYEQLFSESLTQSNILEQLE